MGCAISRFKGQVHLGGLHCYECWHLDTGVLVCSHSLCAIRPFWPNSSRHKDAKCLCLTHAVDDISFVS
jgi:hypothetical protein